MPSGNIVDPITVDTLSVIGPIQYPPLSIGGPLVKECETVKINIAPAGEEASYQKAQILDTRPDEVAKAPYPPALPLPPGTTPMPRPVVIPGTSVFFEGQEVAVSSISTITGTGGIPLQRPLTEPSYYPNILIGTQSL